MKEATGIVDQYTHQADSISSLYESQKSFFANGATLSYDFRKQQLKKLYKVVAQYETQILDALKQDFNKPEFESYATEVGFLLEEINYTLRNLRRWMRPERVSTPIIAFPSRSYVQPHPKGVTLVIAPWNYPFMLALAPVVAAISAGNTVIIKPAEQTPATSALLGKMITENFDPEFLSVVHGEGAIVVPELMKSHRFDHVFFTGSTAVGRKIAEMAAPHLTPVTLELGGKSPAVIDKTANLKVVAKRIAFGKWVNAGQTCVAPDYLLIHESVEDKFLKVLKEVVADFYGINPLDSESLASMIDKRHFESVSKYLVEGEIVFGGKSDAAKLRIEPTVLRAVSMNDKVMQEEIFGPVLPIVTFKDTDEVKRWVGENPNPLAFYVFTKTKSFEKELMDNIAFGGGAINNSIVHLGNPELPFGGVGNSGFGSYHGKAGFEVFSHMKGIMKSGTWFELPKKYPPYTSLGLKLIRWIMR